MENTTSVYIVEDESIVAKDIQNSLRKLGYNVLGISNNGADAIKQIVELEPDIVLMDIMIKGPLTGIDVAEKIKKEYNIPSIFLTAYADDSMHYSLWAESVLRSLQPQRLYVLVKVVEILSTS